VLSDGWYGTWHCHAAPTLSVLVCLYMLVDFPTKMCEPLHGHQFPNNNDLQSSVYKSVCIIMKDWFGASIRKLPEIWQ
jgi:hypothetical protein